MIIVKVIIAAIWIAHNDLFISSLRERDNDEVREKQWGRDQTQSELLDEEGNMIWRPDGITAKVPDLPTKDKETNDQEHQPCKNKTKGGSSFDSGIEVEQSDKDLGENQTQTGLPSESCGGSDELPDDTGDKTENETNSLALPAAACCNTLLAILSLLFNLLIVAYYWFNSTNLPSILYLRNAIADFISAIGFLIQVLIVVMRILEEDVPSGLALCSYWITTVSVRMSVFMNCVLGVTRCLNILNPFYSVNKRGVTISTLMYLLIWLIIASLDVWMFKTKVGLENKVYLIRSLIFKAEPGFSLTSLAKPGAVRDNRNLPLTSLSQVEVVAVQFLTPLALPAALCFVLMIIQIHHLTRQKVGVICDQPGSRADQKFGQLVGGKILGKDGFTEKRAKPSANRRAAVTILIVTTIYVVTCILSVVAWLVVYRVEPEEKKVKKLSWSELVVIYVSNSTLPLLCSFLTALTLFLRSTAMQLHLKETLKMLRKDGIAVTQVSSSD